MRVLVVDKIAAKEALTWILRKHYSHSSPLNIRYAYGIYEESTLLGIVSFGDPAQEFTRQSVSGVFFGANVIELNRMVVVDDAPKNTTSLLVGRALQMLKKEGDWLVVSYADSTVGHVGYIYQATNWIYTGKIGIRKYFVDKYGDTIHPKTLNEKYGTSSEKKLAKKGLKTCQKKGKYRYFFILVKSKKMKKKLRKIIDEKWGIISEYPKGETKRYDAGKKIKSNKFRF